MTGSCFIIFLVCFSILFPLKMQAQSLKLVRISSNTSHVDLGKTLILNATYTYSGTGGVGVIWRFGTKILVEKIRGGSLDIVDSRASIEGGATLVLKNTTLSDNGIYATRASISGYTAPDETFTVIIQVKSIANVTCAFVNITEGENVSCICYGVGGSPPPTAYWLKDNNVRAMGYRSALLDIRNISKKDTGTYTCRVKSGTLPDEQGVDITVFDKPTMISFTSNASEDNAKLGDNVKLTCIATDGYPKPTYRITFKGKTVSSTGVLMIENADSDHTGTYTCFAINTVGSIEKRLVLNVTESGGGTPAPSTTPVPSTTPAPSATPRRNTIASTEKSISDKNCGGTEWYIVVIAVFCGLGIGIIFCYTIMWLYRRRKEKRDPRPSQARGAPETHDNPSVYQELDLQRMNKEDNYQSLRKTSRPVNRQEPTAEAAESSYQELDKVRGSDDDSNYQSLNRV